MTIDNLTFGERPRTSARRIASRIGLVLVCGVIAIPVLVALEARRLSADPDATPGVGTDWWPPTSSISTYLTQR